MKTHLTLFTLAVLASSLPVSAGLVRATATNAKGNVTVTQPSGRPLPVHAGDQLSEGSTVTTGANSEVTLTPVPGSSVSLGEKGSVTLERVGFTRDGAHVQSREAELRVTAGTVFFGLEKGRSSAGKLEIITPFGTFTTTGGAGTVGIRNGALHAAIQSGSITFGSSSAGSPATFTAGSILTVNQNGAQVTNLISGTVATYDAAGQSIAQRSVTGAELAAARGTFESSVALANQVAGASSLSSAFVASITESLTQVNQSLTAAGLQPVNSDTAGSTSGQSSGGQTTGRSGALPFGLSFSNTLGTGSINPANVSGHQHSPER
jgi:FecR protein